MKQLHYYFAFMLTLIYVVNITLVIADQQGLMITFWPIIMIDLMFIPTIYLTWYTSVYWEYEDKCEYLAGFNLNNY